MARVSAEVFDVLLHPLHGLPLVFQAVVDAATCLDFLTGEETVGSNAVVDGDHDDAVSACEDQACAVEVRVGVGVETATLDEEVDGEL